VRRETERACALWQREWRTGGLVPVLVNLFLFTLLSSGKSIVVSFNFFPIHSSSMKRIEPVEHIKLWQCAV
jgi:hypothetical protein